MATILSNNLLVNGLRTEFADTYLAVRNRQSDSRLALVHETGVQATNRQHDFGYVEAAPHVTQWRRGDTIPTDAMGSVQFNVVAHTWGRRIGWHREDRADDQTQTLLEAARMAGESHGLLDERFFFDLLANATDTLPAVPNAPDGAAFFATTAGGAARFGATSGNLLTGTSGTPTVATIQTDYYTALEQFMAFQDGKGQPMLAKESIDAGTIIIHPSGITKEFEEAFKQVRQGIVLGTDAGTTPSNVVHDASRNVTLWGTPRLSDTNDWYVFLRNPPKKATFTMEREPVQEETSLTGDNNGDHTRDTGEEYIQWHSRSGAGIALPYGAIKISNA